MSTTRIPTAITEFNKYINRTDDYLQDSIVPTNGARLGITNGDVSDWHTKRGDWDDLYLKYSDPNQSTTGVKHDVQTFIKDFRNFANPLLDIMAADPDATEEDAREFNFVLTPKKATHRTEAITDKCFATAEALGGGQVKLKFRTSHDTKRASLATDANSVQIAWKAGTTPPANADDGTTKELFTKATAKLDAGIGNGGKNLYLFQRWYNTKHPALASPWGAMLTTPIL